MKTAILAVIMFLIMIFPHELGHFIAAKKCNVQVNEFAFGMGPVIWKKQRGETLHSIRLFPIGGFCAMEGEDGTEEEIDDTGEAAPKEYNPRAFNNKKPWQKIIILAAGSAMNVLSAFLILTILVTYLGVTTTVIDKVVEGSPAEASGMISGDRIVSIDGTEITSWDQVSQTIQASSGKEMTFTVDRDGEAVELSITPVFEEERSAYIMGAQCKVEHSVLRGISSGARGTVRLFGVMFESLKMLISGGATISDISGPVGIVQMVGETSSEGFWSYGFLVALICVNLAVINMLPLPALDGGRILIILVSWITGKAVSPKVEGMIHAVGIVLLLGLAVLVTFSDIRKLVG